LACVRSGHVLPRHLPTAEMRCVCLRKWRTGRKRVWLLRRSGSRIRHNQPDTPTPWLNYIGEGGTAASSPIPGAATLSTATHVLGESRAIATIRYRSISRVATSTCATRNRASTGAPRSAYQAHAGLVRVPPWRGLHRISSSYRGIAAELLYFVPPGPDDDPAPCELWVLRVRNDGSTLDACARLAMPSLGTPTPSPT